ncbi:MAG: molybdopterin molybdotransferase MoeA, partial [Oxalobacter sp.]
MLTVEEAYGILLKNARQVTGTEKVALDEASGHILAEDIHSDIQVPSADNSAMDGYAFRYADIAGGHQSLTVSQRIPAGSHGHVLRSGEAARIFTGAPMPEGADTVVRQEWCIVQDDRLTFSQIPKQGDAVRYAGDDIRKGFRILKKGTLLHAQHLGLLASIGRTTVTVLRRLKVALLVTGDELVEPGQELSSGKIYNSNQTMLKALLTGFGCTVSAYGIVPDDFEVIR